MLTETVIPDVRRFFTIAAELVFSFFYPPICGVPAEIGGNAVEIGGNAAEIPGKQTVLRRSCFGCGVFGFAADFSGMRREFPPQCVAAEFSAAGSSRYFV